MALAAPVLIGNYYGDSGGATTLYYWVQAVYPWGRSSWSNYAKVTTPAALSKNNVVGLNWTAMPGAMSYDIVQTTTTASPSTGSIGIATGVTGTSFTDNGITPVSYTVVAAAASFTNGSAIGVGAVNCAHAIFDFSVDGGAQGAITPASTATIPAYAIMIGAVINSTTAVTSDGSATLAVGTTAGSAANSILTATAKGSLTKNAIIAGAPSTTPVKMSAAGSINVTVGTAALTAGVVEVFVWYVCAANSGA